LCVVGCHAEEVRCPQVRPVTVYSGAIGVAVSPTSAFIVYTPDAVPQYTW